MTLLMNNLRVREFIGSFIKYGNNICCFLSNILHTEIITKNTWRCIHFHSSKLTLRGANTHFSGDLYFSEIDFILSSVLFSQFFLIIFENCVFAGLSRSESVSTELIFEKSLLYYIFWLNPQYSHIQSFNRQFEKHMGSIRHLQVCNLRLKNPLFLLISTCWDGFLHWVFLNSHGSFWCNTH